MKKASFAATRKSAGLKDCTIKKQSFTLLELLIAFALISTIIFSLLFSLRNFLLFEKKIAHAQEEVHQNLHVHMRLHQIFSQLLPPSLSQSTPSPSLYTLLYPKETQKSLVCIFDNGLDPDPKFSGPVAGRIFLTKDQELHLILWPLEKDGSLPTIWREEVLLVHVENFYFEFFSEEKKDAESIWSWKEMWPQEKKELPLMIRLSLQKGGRNTLFAFFPPAPSFPIYKDIHKKVGT